MFTVYITPKKELVISNSDNEVVNQHNLKYERTQVRYDPQNSQLTLVPVQNAHTSIILHSYFQESRIVQVHKKIEVNGETLEAAIAKRKKLVDQSWQEYFSINELVRPYISKNETVPKEIREEVAIRRKAMTEKPIKTLIELLT